MPLSNQYSTTLSQTPKPQNPFEHLGFYWIIYKFMVSKTSFNNFAASRTLLLPIRSVKGKRSLVHEAFRTFFIFVNPFLFRLLLANAWADRAHSCLLGSAITAALLPCFPLHFVAFKAFVQVAYSADCRSRIVLNQFALILAIVANCLVARAFVHFTLLANFVDRFRLRGYTF